jgi:hypothetical protein
MKKPIVCKPAALAFLKLISLPIPMAAHGGTFQAGPSGISKIPSFQGGADFIVPRGFDRDTFPLFVQTGERVTVTPSGGAGKDVQMLESIINQFEP